MMILDYAAAGASIAMVKEVLDLSVGSEGASTWSPLHWVCRSGSIALIKLLLAHGFEERSVET